MKAHSNPFASRHIESLPYIPTGMEWRHIMDRLHSLKGRGAIVGPKGTGKTTLLEELERRLAKKGFRVSLVRLNQEDKKPNKEEVRRIFAGFTPQSALLVDGAEQMPWLAWKAFALKARKAGIFIVTSHTPGLLPTLVETATSPELLRTLANQLLPKESPLYPAQALSLFNAHQGNIRMALRELYDMWALR
ncbi:MAG: hypothetical protein JEZ02_18765 [Desulfatibacillum sp.]|nr:hypothetical protein [Desulfatibacillum sp.]